MTARSIARKKARRALYRWCEQPRRWHRVGPFEWLPPGRPWDYVIWWYWSPPEARIAIGKWELSLEFKDPALWEVVVHRGGQMHSVVRRGGYSRI